MPRRKMSPLKNLGFKSLKNLNLGQKTTLMTATVLVLGVTVFSLLGMRAVNQATEAMLQDRLTTARLVADYIDEATGRALAELQGAGRMIDIDKLNGDAEIIAELEADYARLAIYPHGIYLLDATGRILRGKPGAPQLEGISMASYPGISQTLNSGQPSISGLAAAPVTGVPVIMLASPTGGASRGALVAAIDLAQSRISGFVRPIVLGQTGYVEIVDQNGMVIARTEPGPSLAPFEKSDHSGRFAALIAAGEPTRGLCHTCHEPLQKVAGKDVLAFVPLSVAEWGAVIRQSEKEAMAPIRELRQNLLLSGAALLAFAFLLVVITTRDIVSHLRMLTASSRRIARGDLTSPVTTNRRDEVGILAHSFDEMRIKLRSSYGELEQRTEELTSLLAISDILTSLPDLSNLDAVLDSALAKTLEIIQGDAGGILLLDKETQRLRYRAQRGLAAKSRKASYRPEDGIVGRIARTGETVIIGDVLSEASAERPAIAYTNGIRAFAGIPLRFKQKVLGVMHVASQQPGKFSPRGVQLLEGIARQIATAVENAELHQEVQQKEEVRGELLREIFSVQEDERKRIARELHDETSQSIASLNASLEVAVGMLPTSIDRARDTLRKAQTLSVDILDEIHRLIYELRPTMLDDLGLVAAIGWLAENKLEAAGVKVDFKTVGQERRLPPPVDTTLFRVIQEAVSNIVWHSHARHARIRLHFKRRSVDVLIRDDGQGFDVNEAISSKERPRGLGLLGMKERVELANGSLHIRSQAGGGGTEVKVKIPLKSEVQYGEQD